MDSKCINVSFVTQVITCAEFHPQQCHTFAYSSSKGGIKLGDMRAQALCDSHAKIFEAQEDPVRPCLRSEK